MALETVTKLYGVDDIKLFPVTEDSASAFTYGSEVDVPGARQISLTFEIESKELRGDEKLMDLVSKAKSITAKVENAKLSLDVLTTTLGGSVSSDSNTATFSFGSNAIIPYFQLHAQIKQTDNSGGDLHFVCYKTKITSFPINGTQDDYAICTFEVKGTFTNYEFSGESKLMDIKLNATATDIAGVGSATAATTSLSTNIVKTDSGGVIGVSVAGVKFASESAAESTSNYTFSYGTTGLTVGAITYINPNVVAMTFTGTAAAGTLSITPKAAVMANGVQASAATFTMT
jgi:hypothetical protein